MLPRNRLTFEAFVLITSLALARNLNAAFAFSSTKCPITTLRAVHPRRTELHLNLNEIDRRTALTQSSFLLWTLTKAPPAFADDGEEGLAAVTQSRFGTSIRKGAVQGARVVDRLDEKWERFSDGLRDKNRCDPVTNRRLFDNGFRKDGTRVGDPVLGALCDPVPLRQLDEGVAGLVLQCAKDAALDIGIADGSEPVLTKYVQSVEALVGPSFARSKAAQVNDDEEEAKRQNVNMALYTQIRAYSELLLQNNALVGTKGGVREATKKFELAWGKRLLRALAPNANRRDYSSPFPAPEAGDVRSKEEESLLDVLGVLSVAYSKLNNGGIFGQFEISVPPSDDGNVVTLAVDDDISLNGQILLREQGKPLAGSAVLAIVRAAMDNANLSFSIDSFFLDPSTTKQDVYNPTQLLVNLSNFEGK